MPPVPCKVCHVTNKAKNGECIPCRIRAARKRIDAGYGNGGMSREDARQLMQTEAAWITETRNWTPPGRSPRD